MGNSWSEKGGGGGKEAGLSPWRGDSSEDEEDKRGCNLPHWATQPTLLRTQCGGKAGLGLRESNRTLYYTGAKKEPMEGQKTYPDMEGSPLKTEGGHSSMQV